MRKVQSYVASEAAQPFAFCFVRTERFAVEQVGDEVSCVLVPGGVRAYVELLGMIGPRMRAAFRERIRPERPAPRF